jgi:hypothetical protein
MSQKVIVKPKIVDPSTAYNRKILADRKTRLEAARPVLPDLGLDVPQPKEPANATEFMDVFDKKAFGYGDQATITKLIYGPDPLVDHSPAFREAIERYGREDMANHYAEAIMTKGAAAMPDMLMAKSLASAIDKFGAESVAEAFRNRVLKIPVRSVEIDASDELDPEVMGSAVLAETVRRNERPGMEYRFFTELCVDRMGWRGYTPVKKNNGDIEKAGTLMLGEISRGQVEKRRMRQRQLAAEKLDGIQEGYQASQEDVLRSASAEGIDVKGISGLRPGESVTARAGVGGDDPDGYLGQTRNVGVEVHHDE